MPVYKYAGFWRRLVAYCIDNMIITIALTVLILIAFLAFLAGTVSGDSTDWINNLANPERISSITLLIWAFSVCVTLAYFTYFHGTTGRTPGKMLLGLQVIAADGSPISFGIAFLRSVGYLVSSIVFCLGYIWIGFDKKKQGWHDKIAGTVVIIREQQNNVAGISIPDAAPRPSAVQNDGRQNMTNGNPTGPAIPQAEPKPNEGQTGADGQKIP